MKPILLRGHEKPITAVKFNFDGDLLFTGAGEKRVNLWYSMTGERIGSFEPKAAVRSLDCTVDSKYLVIGTNVGTLEFFTVDGGRLLAWLELEARIKTVQLSYGDKKLLLNVEWYSRDEKSGTTEFLIYDFEEIIKGVANNKIPEQLRNTKPESVFSFKNKYCQIGWGLLGKTILAAREDGYFEIVDLNGKVVKSIKAHDDRLNSFSVSKDHAFLVSCSNEGVKILDPEDLTIIKAIKTEVPMNAGAISPLMFDPKNPKFHGIIGGGVSARDAALHRMGGFEVRLVNVIHEEEIGKIAGHFGPINTLSFYPDGRGFVSGGEEGIIRLFRFDEKYFKDFE